MSDMKCVKCNSDLERIGDFYACSNPHCPLCGDKNIWQELIRTRKALDVAIRRLDQMTWGCDSCDAEDLLKQIKQITALEQKE